VKAGHAYRLTLPLTALVLGLAVLAGAVFVALGGAPPHATIGGPFRLVDQEGKIATRASFLGEPLLIFFGYTHCPDDCPTTLAEMTAAMKNLGPRAPIRAAFITVDPQRDTPAVLKRYLTSFDPRIVGLTGSRSALGRVFREFRVYYKRPPGKSGDYEVDHSTVVYLMDKNGRFVRPLDFSQAPGAADAILKAYL